jgi:DNA cross-link repair 1A protein
MASQVESIKKIPGTPFMVDGFAFSGPHCRHYFLTHCHSDHTIGLRRSFNLGTIYCTPVSARVLQLDMGLGPPTVVPLQLNVRVVIEGIGVTPLDANHCPGACMFLFEVPDSSAKGNSGQQVTRILHTGDCR